MVTSAAEMSVAVGVSVSSSLTLALAGAAWLGLPAASWATPAPRSSVTMPTSRIPLTATV
jgi:hypothetical protein